MAKHSDIALCYGRLSEAGPLGLAPTTSTTVMLALGDALAMSTATLRGFSQRDFATFHPGGDLGKALTLVEEIMRHGEANCIVPSSITCRETIHRVSLTKGRPGAATVVNETGDLYGIFTDGNLRRCLDSGSEFLDRPIGEVATKNPKSISVGRLAQEALHQMREHHIDQIIVIDTNGRPIGLLDIQDVIDY